MRCEDLSPGPDDLGVRPGGMPRAMTEGSTSSANIVWKMLSA